MKVLLNDKVIAESDDTIMIEGNHYFPSKSIQADVLSPGDRQYTCPWKGEATYYHLNLGDVVVENSAWSYDTPKDSAIERVGKDFSGYVAFDTKNVKVER